ncbi:hypothetical protein RA20_18760 [Leisingera sp. ANG-Vp]|nr:hypothetical protein RA20_18760 [Leisingera sp. ANG-Vp]
MADCHEAALPAARFILRPAGHSRRSCQACCRAMASVNSPKPFSATGCGAVVAARELSFAGPPEF